jgi:catechol 2,3-dioxygenase-like lactoylglutathione lyase family enzyme
VDQGVVRQVVVGVSDLQAAVVRFRDALGLEVVFVDPSGWAVLRNEHVELALASGDQRAGAGPTTLSFRTDELAAAADSLASLGFEVDREVVVGGHETRITCRDADGNRVVIYTPTA